MLLTEDKELRIRKAGGVQLRATSSPLHYLCSIVIKMYVSIKIRTSKTHTHTHNASRPNPLKHTYTFKLVSIKLEPSQLPTKEGILGNTVQF